MIDRILVVLLAPQTGPAREPASEPSMPVALPRCIVHPVSDVLQRSGNYCFGNTHQDVWTGAIPGPTVSPYRVDAML